MSKKLIRLTESELHGIVKESVRTILKESGFDSKGHYHSDRDLSAIERAFCNRCSGEEIMKRGVKVLQGQVLPDMDYAEYPYTWNGNNLFMDAIIEYPNGKQCTLIKKRRF